MYAGGDLLTLVSVSILSILIGVSILSILARVSILRRVKCRKIISVLKIVAKYLSPPITEIAHQIQTSRES